MRRLTTWVLGWRRARVDRRRYFLRLREEADWLESFLVTVCDFCEAEEVLFDAGRRLACERLPRELDAIITFSKLIQL